MLFSLVSGQQPSEWKVAAILNRVTEDYTNEYFIELVDHGFGHVFVQATTFRTYMVIDVTTSMGLFTTTLINPNGYFVEAKGTS